jgi:hypothetical protein
MARDPSEIKRVTDAIAAETAALDRAAKAQERMNAAKDQGSDSYKKAKQDYDDATAAAKKYGKEIDNIRGKAAEAGDAVTTFGAAIASMSQEVTRNIDMVAGTSITNLTSGVAGLAGEINKYTVALADMQTESRRATGFQQRYNREFVQLKGLFQAMGIPMANLQKAQLALNKEFGAFDFLSGNARLNLTTLVGHFGELGAEAGTTAKAMDLMMFSFHKSYQSANVALAEMQEFRKEVGLGMEQLLQNFNQMAPALARFGNAGKEVFKDLQRFSRQFNVEIKSAFDIQDQLDTYRGASEIVGKLQAQFGMSLNAVELMRQHDPRKRLEMVQNEFFRQGLTMESIGYRGRQMIAEIFTKGDVDAAQRIFRRGMDLRAAQEDVGRADDMGAKGFGKRSDEMTALNEMLMDSLQRIFGGHEAILDVQLAILRGMQNNIDSIAQATVGVAGARSGLDLAAYGISGYVGIKGLTALFRNKGVGGVVEQMAKAPGRIGTIGKILAAVGLGGAAATTVMTKGGGAQELAKQLAKASTKGQRIPVAGTRPNTVINPRTGADIQKGGNAFRKIFGKNNVNPIQANPGNIPVNTASRTAAKVAGKAITGGLKMIPVLGAGASLYDAYHRFQRGDNIGAAMELGMAGVNLFGGSLVSTLGRAAVTNALGYGGIMAYDAYGNPTLATPATQAPAMNVPPGIDPAIFNDPAAAQGQGGVPGVVYVDEMVLPITFQDKDGTLTKTVTRVFNQELRFNQ